MINNTRQEWETTGVHLGYRYEGSPIIISDGTPEPEDDLSVYVPTARPGHRAPHVTLSDGRSILDLFGQGFVLLCLGAHDAVQVDRWTAAAHERSIPLKIEKIENPAALDRYEKSYVLVRPDGHVAWRGEALDREAGEILDVVAGRVPPAGADSTNAQIQSGAVA
jgi:hypothetical protein